jgi:hypothetical protein
MDALLNVLTVVLSPVTSALVKKYRLPKYWIV